MIREADAASHSAEVAADAFLRHAGRGLLLAMYAAIRSLKLYPIENATAQKSLDDLLIASNGLLEPQGEIEVRLAGDFIFVNGTRLRLELDNYASFSHLLAIFRAVDLGVLKVLPGADRRDWQIFLGVLLSVIPKERDPEKIFELREKLNRAEITRIDVEPTIETDELLAEEEKAKEAAKRTYSLGVAVTKDLINSVRMGRTTSVARVKRAVQAIVDQVLNNETSLIGLTTLRDYDEYTFTHSVNVCILAVAIGQKLGLQRLQLYDLGMGALLHDVGKARIPVDVLNKTGGLSDEEWRLMQTHPWLGVLTLFNMRAYGEIPYRQIVVAHEHHMKTDLTGYPKALRPREQGIYSRIVAVADGYDAATTRRSYQTVPIQPDQVLREMWENPRRGYDPILVKALINLIGIYPVGTCVILDTLEVAVVSAVNPDGGQLNRPLVRIVIDQDGAGSGGSPESCGQGFRWRVPSLDREGHQSRRYASLSALLRVESALSAAWSDLRRRGRTALIPYLTAGHPSYDASLVPCAGPTSRATSSGRGPVQRSAGGWSDHPAFDVRSVAAGDDAYPDARAGRGRAIDQAGSDLQLSQSGLALRGQPVPARRGGIGDRRTPAHRSARRDRSGGRAGRGAEPAGSDPAHRADHDRTAIEASGGRRRGLSLSGGPTRCHRCQQ